ncbi:MAG: hypothetical protein AB8B62_00205 [Roseobacter sp.]
MLRGRYILCILLALTVLVSVVTRPPGAMLTLQGETLTYTLCTSGADQTVTINLDESDDRDIDLSCDAFTVQDATVPAMSNAFGIAPIEWTIRSLKTIADHRRAALACYPYTSRAPPLLS